MYESTAIANEHNWQEKGIGSFHTIGVINCGAVKDKKNDVTQGQEDTVMELKSKCYINRLLSAAKKLRQQSTDFWQFTVACN